MVFSQYRSTSSPPPPSPPLPIRTTSRPPKANLKAIEETNAKHNEEDAAKPAAVLPTILEDAHYPRLHQVEHVTRFPSKLPTRLSG